MRTVHGVIRRTEVLVIVAALGVMVGAASCTGETEGSVGTSTAGIVGVEPGPGCDYFHTALKTAGGVSPGFVKMWNDGATLVLSVRTEGGWIPGSWLIKDVRIGVGDGYEDFRDLSGAPAATSSWEIPLDELSAGCGDTLQIFVEATVVMGDEEVLAWGLGTPIPPEDCAATDAAAFGFEVPPPEGFCGYTFEYTLCCEEEAEGCTLTQGYWKNHEEDWPVSSLVIGGASFDQDDLDALLETSPRGDASLILAHQYIAALLNVAAGASTSPEVDAALAAADDWFAAFGLPPAGVRASSPAGLEATQLSALLDSFNQGNAGTPHCD